MYINETKLRVRYGETDAMGYMYYGNYPEWMEVGRAELLRELGMPYKHFERLGISIPVVEMNIRYIRPAHYDDLITIRTMIDGLPELRISVSYEFYNETGELITKANVQLAPFDMKSKRVCRLPDRFIGLLKPHYVGERESGLYPAL